jgi:vanillate O-demethylase ferredoxin subunit
MHEQIKPGDRLEVTGPRNHFALDETAAHSVLVAGGIGITPLWAMAQRLQATGGSWELHYAIRSMVNAAFVAQLRALAPDAVHMHADDECGGAVLDIGRIVAAAPASAHFYCCGPVPMLRAFEAATAALPRDLVHLEYFKAPEVPGPTAEAFSSFEVELARSGRVLQVGQGGSILDVLLDAGVDVAYSCMEGICGTCEVKLLSGQADHRDLVLSDAQKRSGESIIVCCSGARSPRLVLDA